MKRTENKKGNAFLWGLIAILSIVWGLSFMFTKIVLDDLEPMEVMAVRWAIAPVCYGILIALGFLKVNYRSPEKKKMWKSMLLLVICQPCLYAICETWGIDMTTASESSIFIAAVPLAVIVGSALIFKNRPSGKAILGVIIGFSGVVCCIIFAPAAATSGKVTGYLILIGAVLVGSMYNIMTNRVSGTFSTVEISFPMTVAGGLFFNMLNLAGGNGFHCYQVFFSGGKVTWCLLYLGLFCGVLAYLIYNYALGQLSATVASCIVTNSINVVGVIAGIVVNKDPWGWYTVVGVILTVIGIAVAAFADSSEEND